jgi:hypothetical protein
MPITPSLELYFGNTETPGLYRTVFRAPCNEHPVVGVRGPLFHNPSLPFIWSTSCVALSLFFVSAALLATTGKESILPLLEGGPSSPAAAIGKLMNKGVRSWLHDIFGSDAGGRSLLSRIILLGNARGRRQGPTTVTLRSSFLPAHSIRIFVDGADVSCDPHALGSLRDKLLLEFTARKGARLQKYVPHLQAPKTPFAA